MKTHQVYAPLKRILDAVAATALLILFLPLMALLAIIVLVAQGKPVLFRQTRPGLQGAPFKLYKFRTMKAGTGPSGSQLETDRLTPVGRFLRQLSLDELPQLWNVVRGDMSLVGPRPLLMQYLPIYNSRQATRHAVRPGLTGLAQVRGRNALTWDQRLELDAEYVEQYSFIVDLRILWHTIWVVFSGQGVKPKDTEMMKPFESPGLSSDEGLTKA